MNANAIWVLDAVITIGIIAIIVGAVVVWRTIKEFLKSVADVLSDLESQVADIKRETTELMKSTRVSEGNFNRLANQLTKLTASADTAVRTLPATTSGNTEGLVHIVNTAMNIMVGYRFFRTFILRRKS